MKKVYILGVIIGTLIGCFLELLIWLGITHVIVWVVCALLGIPFIGLKKVLAIALVVCLFKAILKGDS